MQTHVPFTGSVMFDGAIAIIFMLYGIWMVARYGARFGWLLILVSLGWGWMIYSGK